MLKLIVPATLTLIVGTYALAQSAEVAGVPGSGPVVLQANKREIGGEQKSLYRFQTVDNCQNAMGQYMISYPPSQWNLVCIWAPYNADGEKK